MILYIRQALLWVVCLSAATYVCLIPALAEDHARHTAAESSGAAAEEHAPHDSKSLEADKKPDNDVKHGAESDSKARDKADIVVLLDGSGSMLRPYENPLLKLRNEAAITLLNFLEEGDRIALVEFTEAQNVVRPLTNFSSSQVLDIKEIITRLEIKGIYSEISSAIQFAASILNKEPREEANRIIILLSDGILDAPPSAGDVTMLKSVLINEYLPQLKAQGIKIHTFSLGDVFVDKDFLSQIALGTEAANWTASSAVTIEKAYSDLFQVVKRPVISASAKRTFRIDPNIQEATFYFEREREGDVSLLSPKGEEFNASTTAKRIKWYQGKGFDAITVTEPDVGEWTLSGLSSSETFAVVLTDLKLISDWPSALHSGEHALLQARLFDSKRPVVLPDMSKVTDYSFLITPTDRISEPILKESLSDQGTHGDSEAHDGVFSSKITIKDPGEYKLQVIARGPTFERRQQLSFRVDPRLVSLRVELADGGSGEDAHGDSHAAGAGAHGMAGGDRFIVELSEEAVALKKPKLALFAYDAEAKKQFNIPLTQSHASPLVYEGVPKGLQEGRYELRATLSGEGRAKKVIKGESEVVNYVRGKDSGDGHVVEVVEIEEPKEEEQPAEPMEWPWAILIAGVNVGLGFYSIRKLQSAQVQTETITEVFEPPQHIITALAELEKKAALTQIELDDPILSGSGPVAMVKKREGREVEKSPGEVDEAASDSQAQEIRAPQEQVAEGEVESDVQPTEDNPQGNPESENGGQEPTEGS